MNALQDRKLLGRRIVLLCVGLMLAASAGTILLYWLVRGTDRLPQQLVRFGLTCLLSWKLYSGRPWARGLTVFLLSIAVLLMVPRLPEFLEQGGARYGMLVLTAAYVTVIGLLALAPGVREHFDPSIG